MWLGADASRPNLGGGCGCVPTQLEIGRGRVQPNLGLGVAVFSPIWTPFGIAFVTAFHQILNIFFFLLKLSVVCTF